MCLLTPRSLGFCKAKSQRRPRDVPETYLARTPGHPPRERLPGTQQQRYERIRGECFERLTASLAVSQMSFDFRPSAWLKRPDAKPANCSGVGSESFTSLMGHPSLRLNLFTIVQSISMPTQHAVRLRTYLTQSAITIRPATAHTIQVTNPADEPTFETS